MGESAPAPDLAGAHRLVEDGARSAIGLLCLAQHEPEYSAAGKEHLGIVLAATEGLFRASHAIYCNRDVESLLARVPHTTPPYPPPFGLSGPSGHAIAVKLIEQVANIVTWVTVDAMPEDAEQVRALWPWSEAARVHGTRPKDRPPCIGGRLPEAIKTKLAKLWPDAADALRDIKAGDLDVDDGWLRETMAVELNAAQRTATGDERRKPVHLDYVVEVAKNYLDTIRRVENAEAKSYSQEAIIGLKNHRDHLERELLELATKPTDSLDGDVEQIEEWRRLEKPDDARKLAAAIVRQVAGEDIGTPLPPPAQDAIAEQWPPDEGWHFRAGLYTFRGKQYALGGKLWKLLKHLADARFPSTATAMMDAMGSDAKEESSVRTDLANLRAILRQNHNLPKDSDPIPCKTKGDPSAWELRIDCRAPAAASKPKPKPKRKNKRRISVRRNDH